MDEQERESLLAWCKYLMLEAQSLSEDVEQLPAGSSVEDVNSKLAMGIMHLEHGIRNIRRERADDLKWS